MSLVGPRPERQHYIDQIIEKEPHYLQLTSVRPGITSWGQVKFGYAENVNEMIRRMKYDLLYLKNRSLSLDFKIMFYTVITILKAKGK
jgi:lipopolysaccharide/colanic/teichoic acid biosynthesis glycosyltransferase